MANSAQARKRARQAEKHRAHNTALRSRMRTATKKVVKAISAGDKDAAVSAYQTAAPMLDSMARKGIIHKNKAARLKSRLNAHIRQLSS
ncbi:MAG TPA: 30S ribosomal protein S20 [Chromatiales bacterium]|nr:30S ribosomal protein S20 [Chromatiales bacterium]